MSLRPVSYVARRMLLLGALLLSVALPLAVLPSTAASAATPIYNKWISLGGNSWGTPNGAEFAVNGGRVQRFFTPGLGTERLILSKAGTGQAFEVHGPMVATFRTFNYEQGILGWPQSDWVSISGGSVQAFGNGQMYVQSGKNTANAIWGAVREAYKNQGWERGKCGFPIRNEFNYKGVMIGDFQGGTIEVGTNGGVRNYCR